MTSPTHAVKRSFWLLQLRLKEAEVGREEGLARVRARNDVGSADNRCARSLE